MIKKINVKRFAKELKEAADYLADNKESGGCYRFHTVEIEDKGINKNVSIVLGWCDYGSEPKEHIDNYYNDGYRLAVKVGYQSINNIMQTDYDVDFNQVYDKETKDVYDTEIALYEKDDFKRIAERIVTDYNYVLSSWKSWAHD